MSKLIMTHCTQYAPAYLEIILGGMYAGKTSRLVEIYKQCVFCNISITVINHAIDNRYDNELLSTHDEIKIPCIKTENILTVWNNIDLNIRSSDVILINEGQFFPDLYDSVIEMLLCGKKIYVCGLDGDFERKKFGQMLDIIPLCDKVNKLTSLCSICKDGTPGIFSKRVTSEMRQTVVGSNNYIPVCRTCYDIC